jgi:hypothetical protein
LRQGTLNLVTPDQPGGRALDFPVFFLRHLLDLVRKKITHYTRDPQYAEGRLNP